MTAATIWPDPQVLDTYKEFYDFYTFLILNYICMCVYVCVCRCACVVHTLSCILWRKHFVFSTFLSLFSLSFFLLSLILSPQYLVWTVTLSVLEHIQDLLRSLMVTFSGGSYRRLMHHFWSSRIYSSYLS